MTKIVTSFTSAPRILLHTGYGDSRTTSICGVFPSEHRPIRYAVVKSVEESPGRSQTRMTHYDREFPLLEEGDLVRSSVETYCKELKLDYLDDLIYTEIYCDLSRMVRRQKEYNCIILKGVNIGVTAEESKRLGKLYRTRINHCNNGTRDVRFRYTYANCPLFENVFEQQTA